MNKLSKVHKSQKGIVLITILLVGLLLTFVGISLAELAITQFARTTQNVSVTNALLVAEAGIERSLNEINIDGTFVGYPTEQTFFDNETQGRGTYQTTIASGTSLNEKVITSTGRTYRFGTTEILHTRKVRVTIVGTASYEYNVYTGPGGLILGGNTTLTNTDIYVNGYIKTTNNAGIGTVDHPLNIFVANRQCPTGSNPGATYPQVCNNGTQPISAGNGSIYGSVCATGQTNNKGILPGNGGQGLVVGCVAPDVASPTYDRAAHIAAMSPLAGYPSTSNTYKCEGPNKSWPANLRLNGNVSITKNDCSLTLNGNVYITGDLEMKGHGVIKVANGLATRPVVLVDGSISTNNSISVIPNDQGIGAHFISFKSTAPCSPSCSTVTGTNLYNSQNTTTVDIKSTGGSPGSVFQAYWGKILVGGNGVMGSAIGQTVEMNGTGDIVFGKTLSSGTSTWTVRSYQYDF